MRKTRCTAPPSRWTTLRQSRQSFQGHQIHPRKSRLIGEPGRSDARSTIVANAATIMHRPPFFGTLPYFQSSRATIAVPRAVAAVPQPNCTTTTASIQARGKRLPHTRLHSSEPLRCTRVPPKVGAHRLKRKSVLVANMNDRYCDLLTEDKKLPFYRLYFMDFRLRDSHLRLEWSRVSISTSRHASDQPFQPLLGNRILCRLHYRPHCPWVAHPPPDLA